MKRLSLIVITVFLLPFALAANSEAAQSQAACAENVQPKDGIYNVIEISTPGSCQWTAPTRANSVLFFLVGGGGGGGGGSFVDGLPDLGGGGAGGGGGGSLTDTLTNSSGQSYSVEVGTGGAGGSAGMLASWDGGSGSDGQQSLIDAFSAAGGQGGQGGARNDASSVDGKGAYRAGASGNSFAGGTGFLAGSENGAAPGGGGSASVGGGPTGPMAAGNGGAAVFSAFSGVITSYGGGGGGATRCFQYFDGSGINGALGTTDSSAGAGSSGLCAPYFASDGADGVLARGGGGGGGAGDGSVGSSVSNAGAGGDGGSGVVLLRYTLAPAAPVLTSVTGGDSQLSVAFTAPDSGDSAITSYQYSLDGGSSWTTATGTGSPLVIGGLIAGTSYSVKLRAVNDGGAGPASNQLSASTNSPFVGPVAPVGTSPRAANIAPQPKVTLCHSGSGKNWVIITVAPEAVVEKSGHEDHRYDIIPPFDYVKNGKTLTFAGLNWDKEGQAILNNGCQSPKSNPVNEILDPPERNKVTICHSGSGKNYTEITVAAPAALNGHAKNHDDDIVPPFSYNGDNFPGLNWDSSGQAIWRNGCQEPEPKRDPLVEPADKVSLCHANSANNYVLISIEAEEVINDHNNDSNDIIPPFIYKSDGKEKQFAGRNWDVQGREIFNNGCAAPPQIEPITPEVSCIEASSDNLTYTAHFTYRNPSRQLVEIAAGPDNNLTGSALSLPPVPTSFEPGVVTSAVIVSAVPASGSVTWTIRSGGEEKTATASASSPRCSGDVESYDFGLYASCAEEDGSGGYNIRFGYQNDNFVPVALNGVNQLLLDGQGQNVDLPSQLMVGGDDNAFVVKGVKPGQQLLWRVIVGGVERIASADSNISACARKATAAEAIAPLVRCVASNGDGTYNATFGYNNPNQATVDIATGPANAVSVSPSGPGPESRGQPTAFEPGASGDALTITNIPIGQSVSWTLAYGATKVATAGNEFSTKCSSDKPDQPEIVPPPINPEESSLGVFVRCVRVTKRSYDVTFGYTAAGALEINIPVGDDNRFTQGRDDRGQPTRFSPGTEASAFTVKGISLRSRITWRVVSPDGRIASATSDTSAPSCTVDQTSDRPGLDIVPDPPPPSVPDRRVPDRPEIENETNVPDYKPREEIRYPSGVIIDGYRISDPSVKCRKRSRRKLICSSNRALLPGQQIEPLVRIKGSRLGRFCGSVLGLNRSINSRQLVASTQVCYRFRSNKPRFTG